MSPGASASGSDGGRYYERASEDSAAPLSDPLRFDAKAGNYELWCGIRVLPAFLLVSAAQGLLSLGVLLASVALMHHPDYARDPPNASALPVAGPNFQSSFTSLIKGSADNSGLPVLFFEPGPVLAYVRLLVALAQILAIGMGFYGVWLHQASLILPHIGSTILTIGTAFAYVVLLTWHCVKYEDYFAFCFAGLTLLFMLLGNVVGIHAATELYHYFLDLETFLVAARKRWPEVAREAEASAGVGKRHRRGSWLSVVAVGLLLKHQRRADALVAMAESQRERSISCASDLLDESPRSPDSNHHFYYSPERTQGEFPL